MRLVTHLIAVNREIRLRRQLADIERVHRENGRTEYDKPLDMAKVVDDRFVAKAIAVLGKAAPAK